MNFQKLLSSYTLSDSLGNSREEQAVFSLLLEDFKERTIDSQDNELIFDVIGGKEQILLVKGGHGKAIDFVSWNEILGSYVDVSFVEKQTTIEHFIEFVLLNMIYEGTDEKKREKRIKTLQESFPNADCDQYSMYEMTETIQGKEELLVAGELYHRDEFLTERVRASQLLEEKKAFLWGQKK